MSGSPIIFELHGKRVFVTGHAGMVGAAIVRRLERENCDIVYAARRDLDLRQSDEVDRFMAQAKPDAVIVGAGKVGGIRANSMFPADFITDNLAIALNTIRAAHQYGVKKLLYLGSSCIYPRLAPQPMTPDMLLSGPLEPTNQWYAVAKVAGIKLCEAYRLQHNADFVSVMPTNLYGPGDNYHPQDSHVPAALMRRFHEAKINGAASVSVWGTGTDTTIAEFARLIADIVGYRGKFDFDTSRPDGTPRKLLDVSRINALGWHATIPLRDGLKRMYEDFQARYEAIRAEA